MGGGVAWGLWGWSIHGNTDILQDAIWCYFVCVCVCGVQQLTAGGKPDPTRLFGLWIMCLVVCVCSVGGGSVDWLLDRKCHLHWSQKCISIERFPSCPYWALTSVHAHTHARALLLALCLCVSLYGCLTASFPSLNTQRKSFTEDGKRLPWNYFCCGFSFFQAVVSFNWKRHFQKKIFRLQRKRFL